MPTTFETLIKLEDAMERNFVLSYIAGATYEARHVAMRDQDTARRAFFQRLDALSDVEFLNYLAYRESEGCSPDIDGWAGQSRHH